jgi:hypothetical protein
MDGVRIRRRLLLLLGRGSGTRDVVVVPSVVLSEVEVTEIGRRSRERHLREGSTGEGSSAREVGHLVVRCSSDFGVGGNELLGL